MRWLPLIILVYVLLGVQIGAGPYLTVRGSELNLGMIAVVFVALNARRQQALAAALAIGLAQDILSVHPLGLFACAYVLATYFVLAMREIVYREHPLTHLTFTLFAGLLVVGVLLAHGWVHPPVPQAWHLLMGASYTAVVAVILLYPLQQWRRIFFLRG
jgi:rod shape-determining protein MreD